MPRPLVAFPCGSVSITSVRFSATARQAPRLMAVVVLPTPPFWFAMAMMRDTPSLYAVGGEGGSGESTGTVAPRPEIARGLFHVEHLPHPQPVVSTVSGCRPRRFRT